MKNTLVSIFTQTHTHTHTHTSNLTHTAYRVTSRGLQSFLQIEHVSIVFHLKHGHKNRRWDWGGGNGQ